LPTVAGWWQGSDIADRERAGLLAPTDTAREVATRAEDRAALWRTFNACGASDRECPAWTESDAAVDAAFAYIARTPSPLVMLPLDDLLALPEQANMPGTVDEFPNWRRRLPGTADEIFDAPDLRTRLAAITEIRSRKSP
jgi:4-alpha-glucanotransferase